MYDKRQWLSSAKKVLAEDLKQRAHKLAKIKEEAQARIDAEAMKLYKAEKAKVEAEAKAKAILMEEAELKAMIARKNMVDMSERARYIAKMGIVEKLPCIGPDCDTADILGDKLLMPEEISSVKDYVDNSLSTNTPPTTEENKTVNKNEEYSEDENSSEAVNINENEKDNQMVSNEENEIKEYKENIQKKKGNTLNKENKHNANNNHYNK